MRKNMILIIVCIFMAVMIIFPVFQSLALENEISSYEKRVYIGHKEIYREDGKGKPPGTPGGGKKPPTDNDPQPDPNVNKWGVVIGISDYRGRGNDLQYCDDDARDMYNYLLSMGYPEGNIKLLIDGSAKAKSIMSAIDWLKSWENAESEVVFFYSGHGSYYDGYNDGDSEYRDEGIISADLYLILDGQLKQKFIDFESNKISFTFDSCHSGGMDDLLSTGRVVVADFFDVRGNVIILDHGYGVFSQYAHLSEFKIKVGQYVKHEQIIATGGATGRVNGPHLHFEIIVNRIPVDPIRWFALAPDFVPPREFIPERDESDDTSSDS